MNRDEKAAKYDFLIVEGDKANRELSKLQSQNAGINTQSDEYDKKVAAIRNRLLKLEQEMNSLFI